MTVHDLAALTTHVAEIRAIAGAPENAARRIAACELAVEAIGLVPEDLRGDLIAGLAEAQWNGMPVALMGTVAEEARFWSQRLDPLEAEAYLTAICDVLGDSVLAESARKRLFLTLWETMPADWRGRFIAKVARPA